MWGVNIIYIYVNMLFRTSEDNTYKLYIKSQWDYGCIGKRYKNSLAEASRLVLRSVPAFRQLF